MKRALLVALGIVLISGAFAGCAKKAEEVEIAIDPTCGMEVAMTEDAITLEQDGETLYFCSEECKTEYVESMAEDKITCPTCGMEIEVIDETPSYEYEGKTYYLCSEDCKAKFVADPEKYMDGHHEEMHEELEHHEM